MNDIFTSALSSISTQKKIIRNIFRDFFRNLKVSASAETPRNRASGYLNIVFHLALGETKY